MPGLDRHIRTVDVEEHARLAFRRDCPRCRLRLAGPPPSGDVVPVRAKAALATAAVLASGALPVTSATAQDEGGDDSAEIAPPSGSGSESESGPPITPPASGGAEEQGRDGEQSRSGEDDGSEQLDVEAPPLRDVSPQAAPGGADESSSGDGGGSSRSDAGGAGADGSSGAEGGSDGGGSDGGAEETSAPSTGIASPSGSRPDDGSGESRGGGRGAGADPTAGDSSGGGKSGGDGKGGSAGAGKGDSAGSQDSGARANRRTIERGDCLWSIARDLVGADASDAKVAAKVSELWELNDGEVIRTGDPDLIYPDQELRLR